MGKADLDTIVAEMEDEKKVGKIGDRHENAYDAAKKGRVRKITSAQKLTKEVAAYMKKYHKALNGANLSDHEATAKALEWITAYGSQKAGQRVDEQTAMKLVLRDARKGKMGDLYHDHKSASRDDEIRQYEDHVIKKHIDPFDFKHKSSISQSYVDRHGHVLSGKDKKKFKAMDGKALAYQAESLLRNHRTRVSEYKDTVRQN